MSIHVQPNYKTKEELRSALRSGRRIEVYHSNGGYVPENGPVFLEGTQPVAVGWVKWTARGYMKDGRLVEVR